MGVVTAGAAVALTTAVVYPLRASAADISLGVIYLLAVLLVASLWGLWLGVATAITSALAFNFFHIPPTGRLTIADGENWVALADFLITSVVVSALADAARSRALDAEQRRREADLAAEMSRTLLRGEDLRGALPVEPVRGDDRRLTFPLREGTRQIATLVLPAGSPEPTLRRVQERVVPALERAFANVLENSARHAGGHPVSVRARSVGHRLLVRIVDRGPGIPATQLERVFEPFYRSGNERSGHRGSGLGLAIARGFLDVNGAKVWAESLPNQGTSFVVELPLSPAPVAGAPVA